MSATATLTPPAAPRTIDNGHYRKSEKFIVYDGPLDSLPYPENFDLSTAIESMYTDGCAIVPGVLNAAEVAELRHKMETSGEADEKYDQTRIGWCFNKLLVMDFHLDPFFLRYVDRPDVLGVAKGVLGDNCHMRVGTTWITGPGRKMPLHIDMLPVRMPEEYLADPRVRVPIMNCVVQIYMNDMVADIGPTILVPGSHRAGRAPDNETEWHGQRPQAAMVKAGDALCFRFDSWHGAYSNTSATGERRYIMQIVYSHHSLNFDYPPMKYEQLWNAEVLRQATPAQRALLGGAAAKVEEEKKY